MTHGPEESVVADIVVSSDWMADLLLRRKEIPNHEKGSQTASGSGANQLRPLRRVTILTKIHCICIAATAQLGPGCGKVFMSGLTGQHNDVRATDRSKSALALESKGVK